MMVDYCPGTGNPGMDISWEGFPGGFTYVYQVPSSLMPPLSSDGNNNMMMVQSQEMNVQLTSPNYPTENVLMDSPPLQYPPIMVMPSEPVVLNQICDGNPCRCYSYLNQGGVTGNTGTTWETSQQPIMATTETVMMMSPYQMIPYNNNNSSECSTSISTPSLCSPALSDSQGSEYEFMSPPPTPTSATSLFIDIPPAQNNFIPVAVPSHPSYYSNYCQNGMEISPQPQVQLLSMLPPPMTVTNRTSEFNAHTLKQKTEKKSLKTFNYKQQQQAVVASTGPCEFCKSNGESVKIYRGHSLRDVNGNVTCPILFKYTCPYCSSTGAKAHTMKYCPLMKEKKGFQYKKVRNSVGRLTTMKY